MMTGRSVKVQIDGLKELNEALDDFSKSTSGNILKRAVSAAGVVIAEEAARLAPRRSGELRRGIKVGKAKIISAGKAAFAQAMREGGTRAEAAAAARAANTQAGGVGRHATVQVGPTKNLRQAIPQEVGTRFHPPKPYMRPAWDTHQGKAFDEMKNALEDEIEKAKKRAAKKAARIANKIK